MSKIIEKNNLIRKRKQLKEDNKILGVSSRIQCIEYAFLCWKLAYFKIKYPNEFYEEYFNVYNYGDLNKAVKKGYDEVIAYAEMMSKEEVPDYS